MKTRVLDILPHPHQEHIHLLRRPLQRSGKKSHRHPLQTLKKLLAVKEADGFEVLLLGPDAHGELAGNFGNADEASVNEQLLQVDGDVEATVHFRRGFGQVLEVFGNVVVRGQTAVVGAGNDVHFDDLYPAAWFQMSRSC